MKKEQVARWWFTATVIMAVVGLTIQVLVTANDDRSFFETPASRAFNTLFFFTIQSNAIVAVTSGLLAIRPARNSTIFWVFRLIGVIGIFVTGFVYNTMLAGLYELTPWGSVANSILHLIVPVLAVLGWILFGPRSNATWTCGALVLLYPIAWLVVTLIRGPIIDWYPYPFLNVITQGYARVALNALLIALLFIALTAGAVAFDRWSTRRGKQVTF
ncbi:MAG: Pr6Pr family membrane protein [Longispora sp.]|nr:Pr6Pr family membrane protein [Longispora sp. (in: high G+C Gram-positive bacteria)]